MKTKNLLLGIMFVLLLGVVSAVECDADLNVTPCEVSSGLILNSGVHQTNGIIYITGSGTLDGNGATINGTELEDTGVVIESSNVIINNLNIESFETGISAVDISNLIINNTNINDISYIGIDLINVSNSCIENIELVDVIRGMYLKGSTNVNVNDFYYNNTNDEGERGIYITANGDVTSQNNNVENIIIDGIEGAPAYGTHFGDNNMANNISVFGGWIQMIGDKEDDCVINNSVFSNVGILLGGGATIDNSEVIISQDYWGTGYSMVTGYYGLNNTVNKILNSDVICDALKIGSFDGDGVEVMDNTMTLEVENANFTNCDFDFELFGLTKWNNVGGSGNNFNFVDLPNYGGASEVTTNVNFPVGTYNLGVNIESSNITLDGNGAIINGDVNISSSDVKMYGLTMNTLYDDVAGTKFCDYSTFTGNTITSYSGVNFAACPQTSNYFDGVDTTDFESIVDWTYVDLVLHRDGYGKISYSGLDLSGKTESFSDGVSLDSLSITVDDSDLQVPATITFYGLTKGINEYVIMKDGKPAASGGLGYSNSRSPVANSLQFDVGSFSTWSLVPKSSAGGGGGFVAPVVLAVASDDSSEVAAIFSSEWVGQNKIGLLVLLVVIFLVVKGGKKR